MYLLTTFISMLMIPMQQAVKHFLLFRFHMARLMNTVMKMASNSLRLSSFEDIVSVIVDQNLTMNAIARIIVIVEQTKK